MREREGKGKNRGILTNGKVSAEIEREGEGRGRKHRVCYTEETK